MSSHAANEGFRILEEFACEAVVSPGIPRPGRYSQVSSHRESRDDGDRTATLCEFGHLDNSQLRALLVDSGENLAPAELAAIHQIAVNRLTSDLSQTERAQAQSVAQLAMDLAGRKRS
jgi:hypothetical protein